VDYNKSKRELDSLRKRIESRGKISLYHYLVVFLSTLLTLSTWQYSNYQENLKLEEKFNRESQQIISVVEERMALYENALQGGSSLFAASDYVSLEEWEIYAHSLNIDVRYPGINGIGVIFKVKPEELDDFLAKQRVERIDFTNHPNISVDEHWIITYIEPVDINIEAVGLDMAFESNRITALKKSVETGTAQITGPIVLVQDETKTAGFLFYAPIYSKEINEDGSRDIYAVSYAPFVVSKLTQGALSINSRNIGMTIRDGEEIIYEEECLHDAKFRKNFKVEMYGRDWTFEIWSNHFGEEFSESSTSYLILLAGLMIEFLIIYLFFSLFRISKTSLEYADGVEYFLKKGNEELEKMNQIQEDLVHRYNLSLDASRIATWDWDVHRNVVTFDDRWEEIFNVKISNYEDFLSSLRDEKELERVDESVQSALYGDEKYDIIYELKTGKFVKAVADVMYDSNGKPYKMVGVCIDVTSEIVKEKLLEKKFKDIGLAQGELEEMNRNLEQFVYVVSHDLQSPARKINEFFEFLKEEIGESSLNDNARMYMECIQDSTTLIYDMIESLLDYSTTGKTSHIAKVDIGNLLRETIGDIYLKGGTVDVGEMPELFVDEMMVMSLFKNLIANSVKYNKNVPHISIAAEEKDKKWLFTVKDNGIGIEKKDQKRIFEAFHRVYHKQYSGSGLGLSICKKTATVHGGDIWVEHSEVGKGTTFCFTIRKWT
jgi:CHASE1-domain containing sensor protein/two-component sensor histidine kinase